MDCQEQLCMIGLTPLPEDCLRMHRHMHAGQEVRKAYTLSYPAQTMHNDVANLRDYTRLQPKGDLITDCCELVLFT